MNARKVWFVTGASSGLGLSLCKAILGAGESVVATARDTGKTQVLLGHPDPEQCLVLPLDVKDAKSAEVAVDRAVRQFGRLDIVVNNAGHGAFGAFEETSEVAIRELFETNVFGVMNVLKASLPQLRRQRNGHIVQISSLAGIAPPAAGLAPYASTKFAVEGLNEAISKELAQLGIGVTIVEPGDMRTNFGAALSLATVVSTDYFASVGSAAEAFSKMPTDWISDPDIAARSIVDAISSTKPPLRLIIGEKAREEIRSKLTAQLAELERWS